eukprot:g3596.t1
MGKRKVGNEKFHLSKRTKYQLELSGHGAIYASCRDCKEREAVEELIDLLSEYADALYPVKSSEEEQQQTKGKRLNTSAADELAAEIMALQKENGKGKKKKTKNSSRFKRVQIGVRCMIVVRVEDATIDPVHLVSSILDDLKKTRTRRTRYCIKLFPCQFICSTKNHMEHLSAFLKPLLVKAYETSLSSKAALLPTFAVYVKRQNSQIERMKLIHAVANLVETVVLGEKEQERERKKILKTVAIQFK